MAINIIIKKRHVHKYNIALYINQPTDSTRVVTYLNSISITARAYVTNYNTLQS